MSATFSPSESLFHYSSKLRMSADSSVMMLSTPISIIESALLRLLTVQTWTSLPRRCTSLTSRGVALAALMLRKSASILDRSPTARKTMKPVLSSGNARWIFVNALKFSELTTQSEPNPFRWIMCPTFSASAGSDQLNFSSMFSLMRPRATSMASWRVGTRSLLNSGANQLPISMSLSSS